MQDPKIKPKRMINIKADCVKAVNMYMLVKAESNDFIKLVHKTKIRNNTYLVIIY